MHIILLIKNYFSYKSEKNEGFITIFSNQKLHKKTHIYTSLTTTISDLHEPSNNNRFIAENIFKAYQEGGDDGGGRVARFLEK